VHSLRGLKKYTMRKKKSYSSSTMARKNKHANLCAKINIYTEEHLIAKLKKVETPLILILDGIQDPHNLGACLRTADAAGVTAVIAPRDKAVTITETVRKIACGGAESVMFVQVTNLAECMKKLKAEGVWIIGTSDKAEKSFYDMDLKGSTAIVIGSEGSGMRRLTTDRCDFLAKLPMFGKVDCLNASVSSGIVLYEAVRQRL
jgi:23S rRNA (guanosine2251-2'-O)-methyltransferase